MMFQLLQKENLNYYRKKNLVDFCLTADVNKRGISLLIFSISSYYNGN